MAHELDWKDCVARLRAMPDVSVNEFEIGNAISKDDRQIVKLMEAPPLPQPVMQLLEAANGVTLSWKARHDGKTILGSINIIPFKEASLREGASEDDEPLENLLWNDEFEIGVRARLQAMSIFEAIAGQSSYLTYRTDDPSASLFLVQDDEIIPLVPEFAQVVDLLHAFAGIDGLREHLTYVDWEERIAGDSSLQLFRT